MVNWLKVSCRRRWIDVQRHRGVIREVTLMDAESMTDSQQEGPDEVVERSQAIEVGKEAVLALPKKDQTVFRLRYQLDLSPEEIQERVPGLSPRAYRKIIQRANSRVLTAFERIERGDRCEELQREKLRLFAAGDAAPDEAAEVEAHLSHCRSCRHSCIRMRDQLRDVGSSLAVVVASGSFASSATEITQEVVRQAGTLGPPTRGLRDRGRDLLFKLPGINPGPTGEATLGEALGVSGKIVAYCFAGAAATGCSVALVATGTVAPLGFADDGPHERSSRPARIAPAGSVVGERLERPTTLAPDPRREAMKRGGGDRRAGAVVGTTSAKKQWSATRSPDPKPRSKPTESGQETGSDFGPESDGAGSYVSPAEIEAATESSGSTSSTSGGSSTPSSQSGSGPPSTPSGGAGGGSAEFGM